MGHQRVGPVPKTKKWAAVVEKIAGGGTGPGAGPSALGPADIAREVLVAAEGGFDQVKTDPGFTYTVYLLTQTVLAARGDDWPAGLGPLGIRLDPDATVFDLTGELHRVIDEYRRRHRGSVTIGEMAQQAAGDALSHLAKDHAATLFGRGRDELRQAVRRLSTRAGFSDLGQRFFGNFTARFLDFYVSKIIPRRAGKPGFQTPGDLNDFRQALFDHCHQSARIVHDFCGQWYSKTEWERGIDLHNTAELVGHALNKMRDELRTQREGGS